MNTDYIEVAEMYILDENSMKNAEPYEATKCFISRHIKEHERFRLLENYYNGKHRIINRTKDDDLLSNNRLVCNHAKEISDTATGYFLGNPISYTCDSAERLNQWLEASNIEEVDFVIAKNMSKFGRAYELVCMSEEAIPKSYALNPYNAFLIYDDTIEHKPIFGVYYYPTFDTEQAHTGYKISVYTYDKIILYKADTAFNSAIMIEETDNLFGDIPMVEYSNNEEQQGDYEQVISLIDAYNTLMSDRVNDKEQFVDSILLLINATLGDTPEETTECKEALVKNKLLELPSESDARYLTRTFDESGVEILKKALEQDIHKFANVPCLSDENFAGNSSGVAMEYKLLGLEMIVKIKERFFRAGAKRRIELYDAINIMKGGKPFGNVELTFTRGLPKNVNDIASVVSQLDGIVPSELLLPLLPFIKDAKGAMKLLKEEKAENTDFENARFGVPDNLTRGDGYEE